MTTMKRSWVRWLLLSVMMLMGSSGCGSSDAETSGEATDTDPSCSDEFSGPVDPAALIDDMEDQNGTLAQVGDRNGVWWISTDGTGGTVTPQADASPNAERILGGRCDSRYAMRITGSDFSDWGAVLSVGFRYGTTQEAVDLGDFDGVMLWARVGETHSSDIRVQFQDSTTHPDGGKCKDASGSEDACWDGWGTEIAPLSTEWKLYQIRFDSLAQRNYGLQGDAFDSNHVYSMDFLLQQDSVFDLWLDDLWLYQES